MSPVIVDSCSANLGKSVSTHSMLCPVGWNRLYRLKHSEQQDEEGGDEDFTQGRDWLTLLD
ncbi:hypothetical protein PC123_g25608 [Phytophthora cactorum]|nr:hypothetical protein PC123_g25608 [Phytophthora cactorum]